MRNCVWWMDSELIGQIEAIFIVLRTSGDKLDACCINDSSGRDRVSIMRVA